MTTLQKSILFILALIIIGWVGYIAYTVYQDYQTLELTNQAANHSAKLDKNINQPAEPAGQESETADEKPKQQPEPAEKTETTDSTEEKEAPENKQPAENTIDTADDQLNFSKNQLAIYFLDEDNYAQGQEPYEKPVVRTKKDPDKADEVFVLEQLFWGKLTQEEQQEGLTRILSGTTGFRKVWTSNGISEVYLSGDCNSGGSTYTIANLIFKNLKQLDDIDYVKIYDQNDETEQPEGKTDSIPFCLEP